LTGLLLATLVQYAHYEIYVADMPPQVFRLRAEAAMPAAGEDEVPQRPQWPQRPPVGSSAGARAAPPPIPPPLPPGYAELRAGMPPLERSLVTEGLEPELASAPELIEQLGLADTQHDWASHRCGSGGDTDGGGAGGGVCGVESVLSSAQCAALRAAVDAAALRGASASDLLDTENSWQSVDTRDQFLQLELTRESLARIVGEEAVASLWKLSAKRWSGGEQVQAATAAEPHNIFARRYSPASRPWCPFHYDVARCTVNVAVSADAAHGGGRLLAVLGGRVVALERGEGQATVHPSSLLHAVSRMWSGWRYSLIIFSGEVCPRSTHRLVPYDRETMASLYPEEQGSYHCDGCGDSAATLDATRRGTPMHHCAEGCDYALCGTCFRERVAAVRSGRQPEPEPELEYPDPADWLRSGHEEAFAFLQGLERARSRRGQVDPQLAAVLCEAMAEDLATTRAAGWEMSAEDREEVEEIVQHYIIWRTLSRPPFCDMRPMPSLAMAPPAGGGGATALDALPVLVINLPARADRRRWVDEQMGGTGIAYEFFEATDGGAMDLQRGPWRPMEGWALGAADPLLAVIPGTCERSHRPWWHNQRYGTRAVSRGEMGCTVSHIRAWKEIVARGVEAAVVLEDDWGAASVASFVAAVLAEIYLCNVCSCREIMLRRNGRG
jgi:hypothetical protein